MTDREQFTTKVEPTLSDINSDAFKDCCSLPDIYLPKCLQSIGESVFYGCSSLRTITFSGRIKNISLSAFEGCDSLQEIIIPIGSKEYFSLLFRKIAEIDSKIKLLRELVQLEPRSQEDPTQHSLESKLFDALSFVEKLIDILTESPIVELKNPYIDEIVLDNTKSSKDIQHFFQAQSTYSKDGKTLLKVPATFTYPDIDNEPQVIYVKKYEMAEGIQHIDDTAFDDNNRLEHIIMSNSVITFGHSLRSCRNLKSIVLSTSIKKIEPYSFCNLKLLTSISIPDSVSNIGFEAFGGCESLKSIELSSNTKVIEHGTFNGCISLEEIVIPEGIEYIGNGAFIGCKSLQKVFLPSSLNGVGIQDIFYGCDNLKRIIVSAGEIPRFKKILPQRVHNLLIELYFPF